jgi:putative hydrolase of the HAD superfamily
VAIEAVIFDYGGVLTTAPFAGLAEHENAMGYPAGSLRTLLFGEPSPADMSDPGDSGISDWHLLETGQIELSEFHRRLVERSEQVLGSRLDLGLYGKFLRTLVIGIHWMVVHKARELREQGYRIAILTNNIREWGQAWRATIPLDIFDEVVDSCEVGLRKPDPAIFRLTCDRLGVAPEVAVFLDDSRGHVEAARSIGLHGIVVTDPVTALAELDELLAAHGSPSEDRATA